MSACAQTQPESCRSGKRRFRDKLGAEIALASTQRKRRKRRKGVDEVRVYECPFCRGWHLTSEASRG